MKSTKLERVVELLRQHDNETIGKIADLVERLACSEIHDDFFDHRWEYIIAVGSSKAMTSTIDSVTHEQTIELKALALYALKNTTPKRDLMLVAMIAAGLQRKEVESRSDFDAGDRHGG